MDAYRLLTNMNKFAMILLDQEGNDDCSLKFSSLGLVFLKKVFYVSPLR